MKDIFEGVNLDRFSFPLSFSEPTDRVMYSLFDKYFKHRDDHRPGYYSFEDHLVVDITKGFRWYFPLTLRENATEMEKIFFSGISAQLHPCFLLGFRSYCFFKGWVFDDDFDFPGSPDFLDGLTIVGVMDFLRTQPLSYGKFKRKYKEGPINTAAVLVRPFNIKYVPDEELTQELCDLAYSLEPCSAFYIPERFGKKEYLPPPPCGPLALYVSDPFALLKRHGPSKNILPTYSLNGYEVTDYITAAGIRREMRVSSLWE
jgi:hypothetical protein